MSPQNLLLCILLISALHSTDLDYPFRLRVNIKSHLRIVTRHNDERQNHSCWFCWVNHSQWETKDRRELEGFLILYVFHGLMLYMDPIIVYWKIPGDQVNISVKHVVFQDQGEVITSKVTHCITFFACLGSISVISTHFCTVLT